MLTLKCIVMSKKKTVVVGMSGGVDSSVSALLLKQQGYDVIGLFMKNWEENDENGQCLASIEYEDVIRVCNQIQIPHYAVNFAKEYQDFVFSSFLEEYKKGYTPNPDILCNREIKFKHLLEKALNLGADFLATGHYCQIKEVNGRTMLARGKDPNKDQSYFLYTIKENILKKVLFPLGGMHKEEVRKIAKNFGLSTHSKKDSTGICFIGKRNFKNFLGNFIGFTPGNFQTPECKIVGSHDGAAFYTIGQRKGLKIGGQGEAWFVVDKDIEKNIVVVVQGENHPRLYGKALIATDTSWINEVPDTPFNCTSKIRYRQKDSACTIASIENNTAYVNFLLPQKAITPRQSIVFYREDLCLGGAIIQSKID
jgi:tRNA-specific 2-thiouridylase